MTNQTDKGFGGDSFVRDLFTIKYIFIFVQGTSTQARQTLGGLDGTHRQLLNGSTAGRQTATFIGEKAFTNGLTNGITNHTNINANTGRKALPGSWLTFVYFQE